jgi:hypothetical protein
MGEKIMRIILACALAGLLGVPAFGQGVDPLIGTWKFNPEKSTANYRLGSMSFTVVKDGENMVSTVEGVNGESSKAFKMVFQHIYDGMPHPATGGANFDSIAFTRIGNTLNQVRFQNGKPSEVGQSIIVPGKTFTTTAEGIAPNGFVYRHVLVFERQ